MWDGEPVSFQWPVINYYYRRSETVHLVQRGRSAKLTSVKSEGEPIRSCLKSRGSLSGYNDLRGKVAHYWDHGRQWSLCIKVLTQKSKTNNNNNDNNNGNFKNGYAKLFRVDNRSRLIGINVIWLWKMGNSALPVILKKIKYSIKI